MITGSPGQEVTTTRRSITIKSSTIIGTGNGNENGNGKHDRSSRREREVEVEIGVKSRPGATTWIPIQVITGVKIPWQVVGIPL